MINFTSFVAFYFCKSKYGTMLLLPGIYIGHDGAVEGMLTPARTSIGFAFWRFEIIVSGRKWISWNINFLELWRGAETSEYIDISDQDETVTTSLGTFTLLKCKRRDGYKRQRTTTNLPGYLIIKIPDGVEWSEHFDFVKGDNLSQAVENIYRVSRILVELKEQQTEDEVTL